MRSRVMPHDLDLNFHVNNGRYLTFADLGRMDWFIRTGCFQAARKEKCMPVIGDVTARFIRQLKAFDRFYVETELLGWSEKWAYIQHTILDKQNRPAAIVVVRGMFWSKEKGGMKPVDLLAATGNHSLTSPELPEWVQKWEDSLNTLSASYKKK
ncbi:thioesterase family protein [Aliidiomarina sp. B3213]|uniref:thioesterase family protein n=1 Tax=Aliidiomarina sp. B3213 TaxID=2249757 RepID=UPI001403ABC4|nr:thioesterase family protein [Aliidiomarina sp. B3213]